MALPVLEAAEQALNEVAALVKLGIVNDRLFAAAAHSRVKSAASVRISFQESLMAYRSSFSHMPQSSSAMGAIL